MIIQGLKLPTSFLNAFHQNAFFEDWRLKATLDAYGLFWDGDITYYDSLDQIKNSRNDLIVRFPPDIEDDYTGSEPSHLSYIKDFSKILCFGESASGEPYCFDFRTNHEAPSVIWWADAHWRRLAPNFEQFFNLFEIASDKEDIGHQWVRKLKKAASKGNAEAQYDLAKAYETARMPRMAEARRWYRKAAAQGFYSAIVVPGISDNSAEIIKWLRIAAKNGNPDALLDIALRYFRSDGVPQDVDEAIRCIEESHKNSSVKREFQWAFGRSRPKDVRVTQEVAEVAQWLKKFADVDHPGAIQLIAKLK